MTQINSNTLTIDLTATSSVLFALTTTTTSTSTSTTSQPSSTPFCLIGSSSGMSFVQANVGPNANIIAKPLTDTSRPTLMFTLDSAGRLITSAGYKVYIYTTGGFNDPQNIRPLTDRTVDAAPNNFALLNCNGAIGGTLSCTATAPKGTSPRYNQFFRYSSGIVAMGSDAATNFAYYLPIVFTLSTTCPPWASLLLSII